MPNPTPRYAAPSVTLTEAETLDLQSFVKSHAIDVAFSLGARKATEAINAQAAAEDSTGQPSAPPSGERFVVDGVEANRVFYEANPCAKHTLPRGIPSLYLRDFAQAIADRAAAHARAQMQATRDAERAEIVRAAKYEAYQDVLGLMLPLSVTQVVDALAAKYAPAPTVTPWREWVRHDGAAYRTSDGESWQHRDDAGEWRQMIAVPVCDSRSDIDALSAFLNAHFPQEAK